MKQRCALYTRKSSEAGLDQQFNSLDAQREACEAFVKSQKSEGWRTLAARYDDGGVSGGSMERPALKRLLANIAADQIEVVVVYKIDRLTRSLANFARMVELFDRHRVSFVSVTQAFNTTSSMGRLTLNVLLSFAQFEREVTGERIRDKIAASKAKGMWMGGTVPLGYEVPTDASRALVLNEAEATTVRTIFKTYLELGSVPALQRWLDARGIRSKRRTTRGGRVMGGLPFSRGALFHLLRNRTYLGLIVHQHQAHPGRHAAIVATALFDTVQAKLDTNARRHNARSGRVARAPFTGRIFDIDGQPMSPSFTHGQRGQVYRYYVSAPLQPGQRDGDAEALQLLLPVTLLATLRTRLEPGETAQPDAADAALLRLILPVRMRLRGGRSWILDSSSPGSQRDPVLIKALRAAHAMLGTDHAGLPVLKAAPPSSYPRRLVRLAFLAPDLQRAILAGRQPPDLTLAQLMRTPIPSLWSEQAHLVRGTRGIRQIRPGDPWWVGADQAATAPLLIRRCALLLAHNRKVLFWRYNPLELKKVF